RREEAAVLNEVLARLPNDYQRVIRMRYWNGLTFHDIAPHLGRSPDAVRKLWYRAVERLQAELAAADGGCGATAAPAPTGD
ncbi:MAG: RNA polymerase sigma factor, partial [Planctomycetaceae bacterium]